MADPLPRYEDRHGTMELHLRHFQRRRMSMPVEVTKQSPRLRSFASSSSIRHPSGLLDSRITPHVVYERHKSVIQHGEVEADDLLGSWDGRSLGRHFRH